MKLSPVLLASALALVQTASAAVVTYQQGLSNAFVSNYAGTDDTFVSSTSPNNNYGGGDGSGDRNSWIGTGNILFAPARSLVRFDLSSFAGQYTQIDSITLTLTFGGINGAGTVDVFAMSAANAGWVEGTAQSAAQAGSSTWNSKISGSTNWAGSAGASTPGVDYVATPLASSYVGNSGSVAFTFTGSPTALTQLIDTWTSPTNPGLLLSSTDAVNVRFRTSERYFPTFDIYPPTLTISYTAVPEPGSAALFALAGISLLGISRRMRHFSRENPKRSYSDCAR